MAEQVLELQITDNESQVESRLSSLVGSLEAVKKAVGKGLGLGDVATDLSKLGKTVNDDISGSTFEKIKDLADAIEKLRNASKGIKLPNLGSLFGGGSDSVNNETNKTNENIDKVSTMLNRYKEVADGITSSINQNIANLTTAIQEQTSAISEYRSTLSAFSGNATGTSVAETTSDSAEAIGEVAEAVSTAGEEMAIATSAMETAGEAADDIGEGFADARQEIASAQDSVEGVRAAIEDVGSIDDYLGMSKVDLLKMKLEELKQKFAEGLISDKGLTASQIEDYVSKIQKLKEKIEELQASGSALGTLKSGFEKLLAPVTKVLNQFGRTARGRLFRAMIRGVTSSVKVGIENMKGYSAAVGTSFATNMTNASNSIAKLKNSIGAAAAPLIETLIPYLQQVISWVISAINYFNQFISLLSGKSSWTRATDAATDATDKIKKSTSGASDSIKELLADFDELNVIQSESDSGGGGTTKATTDYSKLFEEVDEYSEKIKSLVGWIKENIDTIKTVVGEIGVALLAWSVSEAFEGIIGTIAGFVGAAAVVALTCTLTWTFTNNYLETGEDGWLLADVLTTALGTAITAEMVKNALGATAGTTAAIVTLAFSAAVGITAVLADADVGTFDERSIKALFVNAIKAGAATGIYYMSKGFDTKDVLVKSGSAALLVFGIAIGLKAALDDNVELFSADSAKAAVISSLAVGVGSMKLFDLTLKQATGAALITLGVYAGLKTVLSDDVELFSLTNVLMTVVSALSVGAGTWMLTKGNITTTAGAAILTLGVLIGLKTAISDEVEVDDFEFWAGAVVSAVTTALGAYLIAGSGSVAALAAIAVFTAVVAIKLITSATDIDYSQIAREAFASTGQNGISFSALFDALQKEFNKQAEPYSIAIESFNGVKELKEGLSDSLDTINALGIVISGEGSLSKEEAKQFKEAWQTVFSAFTEIQDKNFNTILDGLKSALTSENDIIREQAKELRVSALMIEKNLDEAAAKLEVAMESLVSKIVSGTASKEEIEQYNQYLQALADYANTAVTDLQKVIKSAEGIDFGDSENAVKNATQFIKDVASAADSAIAKIDEGLAAQLASLDDTKSKIDMYVKQGIITSEVGESMKADLDKMGQLYKDAAEEKKESIAKQVSDAYTSILEQAEKGFKNYIDEGGHLDTDGAKAYAEEVIGPIVQAIAESGGDIDEAYKKMFAIGENLEDYMNNEDYKKLIEYIKEKVGEAAADADLTLDMSQFVGFKDWDKLGNDARAEFVKSMSDSYGWTTTINSLKKQLNLSATDMIDISGWDTLSTAEREAFVAAMYKAYGSADAIAALKAKIPGINPTDIFNATNWSEYSTSEALAFIDAMKASFGADETINAAKAAGLDLSALVADGMASGDEKVKASAEAWNALIGTEIEKNHDVGVTVDKDKLDELKEDVNGDLTFDGKVVTKPDTTSVTTTKGEIETNLKDTKATIKGEYTGGDISGTIGSQMGINNMKAAVGSATVLQNAKNNANTGFSSIKATIKSATVGDKVAKNLGKNLTVTPKISVGSDQKKNFKGDVKKIDAVNTPNLLTDSGFKGDVSKIKTSNTPELNLSDSEKKKISDAVSKISASISVTASLANASAFGQAFTDLFNKLKIEFTSGLTKTVMSVKAFFSGGYAEGGFPNSGQLFMARENGMTEYIGSMGGHTAVANNDQIVEGITRGVSNANEEQNSLLRRQNQLLMQLLQKKWQLQPSAALGRDVNRSLEMYSNMTGR